MQKYLGFIYALLAFFLPFFLYFKTLAPTYIPIDSAEFTLCMHFWGMCHPPGFPLYVALGKLFVDLLPIGTLIYKANLFSALFGAGSVLLVYLALVELKVRRELAVFVAFFFAVSQILWEFSTAADVFTFGTFLILLALLLAFKNLRVLSFFVLGLSASHFYLSAVIFPLFVWYFMSGFKGIKIVELVKNSFLYGLVFTLGFFPQLVMYVRMQQNPEINWGHAVGFRGFVDYLRRREFGSIFLIANPVLTFTLLKFIKQIWVFLLSFFANFAGVLPLLAIIGGFIGGLFGDRKFLLLLSSFSLFIFTQLFLLSTIDPLEVGSPFQLNKFYLSAFAIWIVLTGYGLNSLVKRFFDDLSYIAIFFVFLIGVYFLANFRLNNYSDNRFSENMVLDAYSQLPEGSSAVVVSHIAYFGGLYEQKINNNFRNVKILYFPNEKNRDSQKYHPELFEKEEDGDFVSKVKSANTLGASENYILDFVSRNLDSGVFILQGGFEEKFFTYLKPYLRPYGLWWRVVDDANFVEDASLVESKLVGLRNSGVMVTDLELKQQKDDILSYAISYHSAGVYLGSLGEYDSALAHLNKSLDVNKEAGNVRHEIDLVSKTADLSKKANEYFEKGDSSKLLEYGNNLFTMQNYRECEKHFLRMSAFFEKDAQVWNNLGSCSAHVGKVDTAREAYKKALEYDPNLDLAKRGLETLGDK